MTEMNPTEPPVLLSPSPPNKMLFLWYDYTIFTLMLGVSVMIGIYFGCFGSKQSTTVEYLMGGKKMHVIPIAISLVASHISGISLLAVPADIYRHGAAYWLITISFVLLLIVTVYVYLPVFFNLKITSTYEYLQRRFDAKTRTFSSFLFALGQLLFLPIVVYIPALAFSAATGINLHLITPIVCGVCIFYTTIGGLKAVVWTDTIQFTVTIGSVVTVLILGIRSAGGFGAIWQKAIDGQRLDIFNFDLDITERDNFWSIVIGFTIHWISMTNTNQGCVQKFLSVATLKEAKLVAVYYIIGMCTIKTATVITGLIMYARYADCDPFTTKQISRNDQLLPYYVLDVAGHIPGLPGLFIAGVFSAALSTLSAHLNCVAGTIFEDFIAKYLHQNITEKTKSNILKLIVVITGVICTALVFVFEHLGGILPLTVSFGSVTGGPLLGMFTLGVLFRRANSSGAFYGGIIGLISIFSLNLMIQYYKALGLYQDPPKPLSIDHCDFPYNTTVNFTTPNTTIPTNGAQENVPYIFRITFYYHTLLGTLITFVFGLLISYLTKPDEEIIDENLLCPLIHRPPTKVISGDNATVEYDTVEMALTRVVHNVEKKGQMDKLN